MLAVQKQGIVAAVVFGKPIARLFIQGVHMASIPGFDRSSQKTNVWLRDALIQLDWTDRQRGYAALRGVLHALRDRLPLAEIAQLGAQLPTFIRGIYYRG